MVNLFFVGEVEIEGERVDKRRRYEDRKKWMVGLVFKTVGRQSLWFLREKQYRDGKYYL